jgi:hypothetical protein
MNPKRELIKTYVLMLLNEMKKTPKTATTEQLGEMLAESVAKLTDIEKAKLRKIIRREFRHLELFDPRKLVN